MRPILLSLLIGTFSLLPAFAQEPSPGKQVAQTFKSDAGSSISYFLYLPKDYNSKTNFPLMLFLHGRGESKPPLATVKSWGPPQLIEHGVNFHYIIASPQCPVEPENWSSAKQQALLFALVEHLSSTTKTDKDKIYLTGLSMGGSGSWHLAASHPDMFAAVAPLCGRGDLNAVDQLKTLPIWAWVGLDDRKETIQANIDLVAALKKTGATARLTTLEGIGHNCWSAAYASPDLYKWLDAQSASKNREHSHAQ